MGFVIVDGATFLLAVDAPVVSSGIPSFSLVVNSSGKFTAEGKKVALKSDMEGQSKPAPITYINSPYLCPGGTIQWDGILSGAAECAKLTKDGSGLIDSDTNSGVINWDVVIPAQNPTLPAGPPPCVCGVSCTPDSATSYPGTWTLISAGQTKLKGV